MNRIAQRKLHGKIMLVLCGACAVFGLGALFFILTDIFGNGLRALRLMTFVTDYAPPFIADAHGGGLRHALIGQFLLVAFAALAGIPLGVLGGIFLAEYGRKGPLGKALRLTNDLMTSLPSIIVGVFVYSLLVLPVRHYNGWAGAAALMVLMLPVITKVTHSMLLLIPDQLREAAFAIGAPQHRVILDVSLRAAGKGILTGIMLAIARVAGETAPLLFTSLNRNTLSLDMNASMASLTVTIFQYTGKPEDIYIDLAWSGALIITLFILIITILTGRRKTK